MNIFEKNNFEERKSLLDVFLEYRHFKLEDVLQPFNEVYTSNEVRYSCPNNMKASTLEYIKSQVEKNPNMFSCEIKDIVTIDGMRIVFDGGFALIRQSNTEPVFTLRFEAKTENECNRIQNVMIDCLDQFLKMQIT